MRKRSAIFLTLVAAARLASAGEWRIVSSTDEPSANAAVQHRRVVLEDSAGEQAAFDLAVFAASKVRLRVIDNASGDENLADKAARENCVAGVNGGYFDPEFRPIGLRIIYGAVSSPLVRARLLSGVFAASARGVEIVRVSEFSKRRKYDAAIECGPFLVENGKPVGALNDTRSARRTFVAVAGGGFACLGVSSALTLAKLADTLAALPLCNESKIFRALNLDGGSSSAFWIAGKSGDAFSVQERKSVRDFVAVAPR